MTVRTKALMPSAYLGLALLAAAAGLGAQAASSLDAQTEANITRVTAGLLGSSQFALRPMDDRLAGVFLDRYFDALDGERSLFLRSDVAEFAGFRDTLARDTVLSGDTRIAQVVFGRYLTRLEQRVAYVTAALESESFHFTGNDFYSVNRKDASRPANLADARALWLQRLRFDYLQEKLDGKEPTQIVEALGKRAARQLRAMKQVDRDDVLEIYLTTLAQVYDPHSDYLGRKQMGEFAISMNLSLFGIGAKLQSVDGQCRIVELIPGGPAMRSGLLEPGDRIVAVAKDGERSVDVVDMPLSDIVELIRGPKGSAVSLTVKSASAGDDAPGKTIRLVRDEIRLEEQRAQARIVDFPTGDGSIVRLGVVDLPSFYANLGRGGDGSDRDAPTAASATADVSRLLRKLTTEGVRGVILDLRRNGGGSLQEAIDLTGLFISEGPVVQTRGLSGAVDVEVDTDPDEAYTGPLIVLTSRFSASASEILAGALQDYGRAVVVGDASTFGKGTVQNVMPLAPVMDRTRLDYAYDPGALKVTVRKFYRPSGASTQLRGVASDIVLPSLSGVSRIDEAALDNPLPWDAVPAVSYRRERRVLPYLATLREASARRVSGAEEFAYLRGEIERLQKRLASDTVSLNEAARRQELARVEARRKQHELTLEKARAAMPVTYEISVSDAARPDLPRPLDTTLETSPAGRSAAEIGTDDPGTIPAGPSRYDPVLNEAQRILVDYAALLGRDAERGGGRAKAAGQSSREGLSVSK